ncbi:hypothetical protein BH11PSE3_BH11PSE3_16200 [soil metagenome]
MSGVIRRASPEDHDRISDIRFAVQENQLSDPSLVTDEDYAWFVENPGVWVWEEEGRILGFAAGDTRDCTIWALFVDPAHDRRGIGRALFERACDILRQAGHRSALLTTDPGTRAERFYRAAGSTALGTNKNGEVIFRSSL